MKWLKTFVLVLLITACNSSSQSTLLPQSQHSTSTLSLTLTPIATTTLQPTNTSIPKATFTPAPTPIPTPIGGGGGQVAFLRVSFFPASGESSGQSIYLINSDGSNIHRVFEETWIKRPIWSFDGSKLAFIYDYFYTGSGQLFLRDVDSDKLYPIANQRDASALGWPDGNYLGNNYDIAWSPVANQIAFYAYVPETRFELFILDVEKDELRQLTYKGLDYIYNDLAWSPNGNQIAFQVSKPHYPDTGEIYVVDIDSRDLRQLTNNNVTDYGPRWSPDGTKIAFVSKLNGNEEIYVMDADGSNKKNVTNHEANDTNHTWSRDGQKIIFTSGRDNDEDIDEDIYVIDVDGNNLINLTSLEQPLSLFPSLHPYYTLSPDGTRIIFVSRRDGRIYTVNIDGSGLQNLTRDEGGGHPAWSPDGKQIISSGKNGIHTIDLDTKNIQLLTGEYRGSYFAWRP